MKPRIAFSLVSAFLICSAVVAETDPIDDAIRRKMGEQHVAGASVAVLRGGKVVLTKGYGLANVDHLTPAAPETRYQIASATKPFTAAVVLMLAESGDVALDGKAAKYLPGLPARYGGVTVR